MGFPTDFELYSSKYHKNQPIYIIRDAILDHFYKKIDFLFGWKGQIVTFFEKIEFYRYFWLLLLIIINKPKL